MPNTVNLTIHASQYPENVRRDLLVSLRTRRVNHKFHYDSVKQTQKWLALHQACSPTRNDADCRAIYGKSFAAAAAQIKSRRVHVIGLGCGGGQKDTRLLKLLKRRGKEVFYTPCDVSTAMVLTARRTALAVIPEKNCFPVVCDLATADDLQKILVTRHPPARTKPLRRGEGQSLGTFFGMIPNFEPEQILPELAALVRPRDLLLFSANLAPGGDYAAGMRKILPQYDNPLTRDWLMTFLDDLGVARSGGDLRFAIANGRFGLKRVVADFQFRRSCRIEIESKAFNFRNGDSVRLFFSYRYTPERVRKVLADYGMKVCEQWIAKSEEEGVFLCYKQQDRRPA
ncbi:MAG TPA: L-histidine N(alpha)-methyltransferase [Verrucomicrobiae bacterium]|nr:L-histidine N(alpha)-methyltransferase [Verrucomicrobiae bacterium]